MIPNREETGPPSWEGPLSPEQRMEGLCFPFPSLPSRCQPLGAPGLWGMCGVVGAGGWQSLAATSGWIRAAPWDEPPKPSAWEGQGSEGKCRRQRFVSSHLISSPRLQRSEEDLICWARGSGSPCSAGCIPMTRGSPRPPRAARDSSGEAWPHRGGDTWHGDTCGAGSSGRAVPFLPSRAGRLCRGIAAPDRISRTLSGL